VQLYETLTGELPTDVTGAEQSRHHPAASGSAAEEAAGSDVVVPLRKRAESG
jgi:hypothetical protein